MGTGPGIGRKREQDKKLEEGEGKDFDLHIYCRSAQWIEQLRHRWLN